MCELVSTKDQPEPELPCLTEEEYLQSMRAYVLASFDYLADQGRSTWILASRKGIWRTGVDKVKIAG